MVFTIGFLLFNQVTQLDFTGPAQFLGKLSDVKIYFVVKENQHIPVTTDCGFGIVGNITIAECPKLDLICIPGGSGVHAVIEDAEILQWLRNISVDCQYITSVCTGSFVLAAAGLLKGYQATSHWAYRDYLSLFGVVVKKERVVKDRNRITGGGVTAGIDFALFLLKELRGEHEKNMIQLHLEYNPTPVSAGGEPELVSPELLHDMLERLNANGLQERRNQLQRVAKELNFV